MKKVIIINFDADSINFTEPTKELINNLLENGFKIIVIKKTFNNFINKNNIPFKNLANFIELNIDYFYECEPATSMFTVHNHGINLNYPSTIIDCIEKIFYYEENLQYAYISFTEGTANKYTPILDDFFEKNGLMIRKVSDIQSFEDQLNNIKKNIGDSFHKISIRNNIPEFPKYEEILFSDRSGTIEEFSTFFNKLAPFEENINELIKLLKNDNLLLCGISSGNHQEGFLSKNILKKLKDEGISTDNILAFTQYQMASMVKNYKRIPSDKIIMGFGNSTKEEVIKQFLEFLKKSKKLPNQMYAMGDHPLDDIPMLKLVHSKGGEVGFICPYLDKDKIIKELGRWLDYVKPSSYEYEVVREQQYYSMIQNIDENWDWLKNNIYEEAKDFLRKIQR